MVVGHLVKAGKRGQDRNEDNEKLVVSNLPKN